MTWSVFAQRFDTADLGSKSAVLCQRIVLDENTFLLAIRTWLVFYNNPALTAIGLKIYANENSAPAGLLYTSELVTKASILTEANGVREVAFLFNSPEGVPLKAGETYWIGLYGTGYTGDETSHIGWKKAFPDPAYTEGLTLDYTDPGTAPYGLTLIGAEL
jgi:hypothetical protein